MSCNKFRYTIMIASVITTAICFFPLFTGTSGGAESTIFVIRGLNLIEFSAWGCLPIIIPLFIPAIVFGDQAKWVKMLELMILACVNMVSYFYSISIAKEWLRSACENLISYHYCCLLYPIIFMTIILLVIYRSGESD